MKDTKKSASAKRRWQRQGNLIGKQFGKWTVIAQGTTQHKQRKWWCLCECGNEREVFGRSLVEKTSTCCRPCALEKYSGENHHSWKGGRRKSGAGYIVLANGKLEHRYVFEESIGRELYSDETVHHKNGIRSDNRLENLELKASSHGRGQDIPDLIVWAKEILRRYQPEALNGK